jgi:ankyrin repeat protein
MPFFKKKKTIRKNTPIKQNLITATNSSGNTHLHILSQSIYHMPKLRMFLEAAVFFEIFDINKTNKANQTPLDIACIANNILAIKILLSYDAKISYNTLINAINIGPEVSDIIISNIENDILETPNYNGDTPLMIATKKNNITAVKKLIQMGVNLNIKNKENKSALFISYEKDNDKCFEILLDSGAKLDQQILLDSFTDNKIITPRRIIEKLEYSHQYLSEGDEIYGYTPLMNAVSKNDMPLTKLLLKKGVEVDTKNAAGETALTIAAKHDFIPICKELIRNGADPTIVDTDNNFALLYISWKENPRLITNIYKIWASRQKEDKTLPLNLTLNHLLCLSGSDNIDSNQDLNQLDILKRSILHFATIKNNVNAINIICTQNPKLIDQVDINGCAPIHYAFANGCYQSAAALIENNARTDIVCKNGKNLAIFASEAKIATTIKTALLELISFSGIDEYDNLGNNPIKTAISSGNISFLKVLIKHSKQESKIILDGNEKWPYIHYGSSALTNLDTEFFAIALYLCENGYDINQLYNDKTPLMLAVENRNINQIQFLLKINADPDVCNIAGESALTMSINIGDVNIFNILYTASKDKGKRDHDGNNFLMLALKANHINYAKLNIEHHDLSAIISEKACIAQETPHLKRYNLDKNRSLTSIIAQIRKYGRNDNVMFIPSPIVRDNKDLTIIFENAIFSLILDKSCDKLIDETNNYGNTALHLAILYKNLPALSELLQHGASYTKKNIDGKTVEDLANDLGLTAAQNIINKHKQQISKNTICI